MGIEQAGARAVGADDEIAAAMRLGAAVRIVEALLFASREPLSDEVLARRCRQASL